jgi:hypothetical protein
MRAALLTALAVVLLAVPAAASAAGTAAPVTETAASGAVAATFTHQDAGEGEWKDMKITITRAGVAAYSGMPKVPGCAAPYCAPYGPVAEQPSLSVADVSGDGEPEVIVNMYSGGAHCCEIALILRWSGNAYKVVTHNFGDPGYELVAATDGGPAQFLTGDDRFAYEFTDYADSALPFKAYRLMDGAFSDQTLSYRSSIEADAARLKKAYNRLRDSRRSLGVLAAYVADEYQLLRRTQADAFLSHELKAGKLKGVGPWPHGKAYIKLLKKDLKAWGYAYKPGFTQ